MRESVLNLVVGKVENHVEQSIWGVKHVAYPVDFSVARKVEWGTNRLVKRLIRRCLHDPIVDEIRGEAWPFGDDTR